MITETDYSNYIIENFPDVTDQFSDRDHISGLCTNCGREVAFDITSYGVSYVNLPPVFPEEPPQKMAAGNRPRTIMFRCPIKGCGHLKLWVVVELELLKEGSKKSERHTYLLNSIPNENEEIEGVPNDPPQLKAAYKEAIRCLNANAPMAAAAMFRRALQVITRDILGAKPGKLANELKELKGSTNPLGIALTNDFSQNAYILKEAGNQGAHPDDDLDLLSFDPEDAEYLHQLFAEVVAEIFVAPAAAKKAREGFLKKRKITAQ
ncbi:MAG TPA: DUF4145 domain-containing protein [Candidatus Paceibacterota bacterium]|nr:DUF4145 domain-containing protein [Candidatus Paceibacterota bacterium]